MKSSNQRQTHAFGQLATGFVQTMYFDLEFNYIKGSVEQIVIFPDAPDNWESETCKLIPYVRYEYTRVCKKNPENSGSGLARINRARKKIRFFASAATTKGSVLRIVRTPVVIQLQPNIKTSFDVKVWYLEESYGSLCSDPITSSRKTREMPGHLKEKAASTEPGSKSKGRRTR
jgi:hypothetical protein